MELCVTMAGGMFLPHLMLSWDGEVVILVEFNNLSLSNLGKFCSYVFVLLAFIYYCSEQIIEAFRYLGQLKLYSELFIDVAWMYKALRTYKNNGQHLHRSRQTDTNVQYYPYLHLPFTPLAQTCQCLVSIHILYLFLSF